MLLHRFFIENGEILETSAFQPVSGIEIYEVIRVIRGVPVFLEEHLKRFYHSAWLCHLEIPVDENTIEGWLKVLMKANGVEEGNIRFSFCFRQTERFQAYFIPHSYPDENRVKHGVNCGILDAVRPDPNAKVVHSTLKERSNQMISEGGFYEVLLLNQLGELTEGSRSNLFFLKKDLFITASEVDVLPGITRHKVIEILFSSGRKMVERNVKVDELPFVDAAFLTGTSPKVLPIRTIEDYTFNPDHPEIRELITDYDRLINDYIDLKNTINF